ncbi:hypothetical protein K7X08_003909 [Anisodus acutangulus]|uniref:Uncharacterized protein n=1 Tax=Anisodus acutangulus TaxID=402998 RepID=A0A9Q1MJF2_9SOLA|nr:hypothetical protein K7X08_003909 [Anisodus acutangulus]
MSEAQLMDIARFCNRFPDIGLTYDVLDGGNVRAGDDVTLQRQWLKTTVEESDSAFTFGNLIPFPASLGSPSRVEICQETP